MKPSRYLLPKRVRRFFQRLKRDRENEKGFSAFLDSRNSNRIVIYHLGDSQNDFAKLCDVWGSDKGEAHPGPHPYPWPSHTYADYIEMVFGHCRGEIQKVFECGIGTNNPGFANWMTPSGQPGASLRAWRDYFPNAKVFGGDIDQGVLFSEERIKTFFVDQTDPDSVARLWKKIGTGFDLIVDDGFHNFEAGITFFEHSRRSLRADGVYIIEDIRPEDRGKYVRYFSEASFAVELVDLFRPGVPLNDNSLIVIRGAHASLRN